MKRLRQNVSWDSPCWTCSGQGWHAPLWHTCTQVWSAQLSEAPHTLSHWSTEAWPQRIGWLRRDESVIITVLRMTPNIATQYTERKADYLVLPQMQDFVTKAGHCGHGPGWHKLKERQKVLDNVHRWKWPTCTYGHTLVSDDLQAAEWAFQKKKKVLWGRTYIQHLC